MSLAFRRPLLMGAAGLCLAIAAAGCGAESLGGGVSFAEGKQRVGQLVDETYEAALTHLTPKRFPENASPCREAGGAGGATGDYAPNGALEFEIAEAEDASSLVMAVARHWEQSGFDAIQVVPSGESVFAQTDGYRLSFDVMPRVGRAKLGAGGPCATPESDGQREAPVEFESLDRKNASG